MTEHWLWPQWTEAVLLALTVAIAAGQDGEPKKGKHSFAVSVVGVSIVLWILYCGGFWK